MTPALLERWARVRAVSCAGNPPHGRTPESRGAGSCRQSGYSLVALMATVAVMLVLLAAAEPSWRYLVRNDKEEELLFRGGEIADAVARYQRKNGGALPSSLEVLVKGKFLRRQYKDPMTKNGRWRFLRPGEAMPGMPGMPGQPGMGTGPGGTPITTTTTTTRPSAFSGPENIIGGFQGVATTNTDKSLRMFNGKTKYNEWLFLPGQPRIIGRPPAGPGRPGGPIGPIRPGMGGMAGGIPGSESGFVLQPNLAPPPPPP